MYKYLIRPFLFCFSPEGIHRFVVVMLRIAHSIPGCETLLRAVYQIKHPVLEREVFGIRFPNPVGIAAGFDKNAEVYGELELLGFGFVEVGTVTPRPQSGNPKPRLFRLPKDRALINRMGFNNLGMEHVADNLRSRDPKQIIGANLGKNTLTPNDTAPADYLKLFRGLYEYVDYFVINVSCPNITDLTSLQEKGSLHEILTPLTEFRRGQNNYRPILLKISPDLTTVQIDDMIEVMVSGGIDGIVATNTSTGRAGLTASEEEIARIGRGGLSGAPLTKRAVEVVRYIHEKTEGRFPIIGVGGIMTEEDALEMFRAGASLIQIYTGFIYNGPKFARKICKRLRREARQA